MKNFFLQGKPGAGKSYLLRCVLGPYRHMAAGYGVQRLYQGQTVAGFRAGNIRDDFGCLDLYLGPGEKISPGKDGVFLKIEKNLPDSAQDSRLRQKESGKKGVRDLSVLEHIITETQQDSKRTDCRFIILDEIGGSELGSDAFMEILYRLLKGDKPCVGVLKSAANLASMAVHQGLNQNLMKRHRCLEQLIRETGSLLTLTEENRDICRRKLEDFVKTGIKTDEAIEYGGNL